MVPYSESRGLALGLVAPEGAGLGAAGAVADGPEIPVVRAFDLHGPEGVAGELAGDELAVAVHAADALAVLEGEELERCGQAGHDGGREEGRDEEGSVLELHLRRGAGVLGLRIWIG